MICECDFCRLPMVYEANYVPYGSTEVDAGQWECLNPGCPQDHIRCDECNAVLVWNGEDAEPCELCLLEVAA